MSFTHLRDEKPKANKPYPCFLCGQEIGVGETHVKRVGTGEDGLEWVRMHTACESLTKDWDEEAWEFHEPSKFPTPVSVSTIEATPVASQSTALARRGKPLSPSESATLMRVEGEIRKGMASFLVVGNLLSQVRDEKLYRENYQTFESYLADRWDLGKSHGYRLIKAAAVVNALPDSVPKPTSVRGALGIKDATAVDREGSGETRADEPEDDPEPVKLAKANGHIHSDVHVDVTHPEPSDGSESEPQEIKEPTDGEWLETLPARAKLSGLVRDRFDAEALAYRSLEAAREVYRAACRKVTKPLTTAMNGHIGPWLSKHTLHFRIDDPADWQPCADCDGAGFNPLLKEQCPTCRGNGYHA